MHYYTLRGSEAGGKNLDANDRSADDTARRNSQPVSLHLQPKDSAGRDNQRDERYGDRSRDNGRSNGNYIVNWARFLVERETGAIEVQIADSRTRDVPDAMIDHRRSPDRYDPRPQSPDRSIRSTLTKPRST